MNICEYEINDTLDIECLDISHIERNDLKIIYSLYQTNNLIKIHIYELEKANYFFDELRNMELYKFRKSTSIINRIMKLLSLSNTVHGEVYDDVIVKFKAVAPDPVKFSDEVYELLTKGVGWVDTPYLAPEMQKHFDERNALHAPFFKQLRTYITNRKQLKSWETSSE